MVWSEISLAKEGRAYERYSRDLILFEACFLGFYLAALYFFVSKLLFYV